MTAIDEAAREIAFVEATLRAARVEMRCLYSQATKTACPNDAKDIPSPVGAVLGAINDCLNARLPELRRHLAPPGDDEREVLCRFKIDPEAMTVTELPAAPPGDAAEAAAQTRLDEITPTAEEWKEIVAGSVVPPEVYAAPPGERELDGVGLIAQERQRQISVEGWTPEHDDCHKTGELGAAAACYALMEFERPMEKRLLPGSPRSRPSMVPVPEFWPWDAEWWKPTPGNRIRELVKAGALIAAEIDRLKRQECIPQPAASGGE